MVYWAYQLLHIAFTVAPIIAGLDKFFNILTSWDKYLSPAYSNLLPIDPMNYMRVIGVIEIIAGLIVAFKPRIGGFIVFAWLVMIIINLLLLPGYFDVALRDLGLALSALSLSLLSKEYQPASRLEAAH